MIFNFVSHTNVNVYIFWSCFPTALKRFMLFFSLYFLLHILIKVANANSVFLYSVHRKNPCYWPNRSNWKTCKRSLRWFEPRASPLQLDGPQEMWRCWWCSGHCSVPLETRPTALILWLQRSSTDHKESPVSVLSNTQRWSFAKSWEDKENREALEWKTVLFRL